MYLVDCPPGPPTFQSLGEGPRGMGVVGSGVPGMMSFLALGLIGFLRDGKTLPRLAFTGSGLSCPFLALSLSLPTSLLFVSLPTSLSLSLSLPYLFPLSPHLSLSLALSLSHSL